MWHVCRAAGAGRVLYPDHIMAPLLSPLSYSDSTKMSSMKPLIRNIENGQLIQICSDFTRAQGLTVAPTGHRFRAPKLSGAAVSVSCRVDGVITAKLTVHHHKGHLPVDPQ
jgi:hypothetical protein